MTQGPVTHMPSPEKPGVTHEETTQALALNMDTGRKRESSMQVSLGGPGHWGLRVTAALRWSRSPDAAYLWAQPCQGSRGCLGVKGKGGGPGP